MRAANQVVSIGDAATADRNSALLALAGVEPNRPQVARCLLIDPPFQIVDLFVDWAITALRRRVRASALSDAATIQLSDIEEVHSERDRLTLRFFDAGVDLIDAIAIAENWVRFRPRAVKPDRGFQSAVVFDGDPESASEVIELVGSGLVGTVLFIGRAKWTKTARGGRDRADLIKYLTMQVTLSPADTAAGGSYYLLKFEIGRNRPDRVQLALSSEDASEPWQELVWWDNERRSIGVRGGNREVPRLRFWRSVQLPRPVGYRGAPWHEVTAAEGAMLRRVDRHYSRLQPTDASIGTNQRPDAIWTIRDASGFRDDETVSLAGLENLGGGSGSGPPLDRVVWTRDGSGNIRPLEELSEAMRTWIHKRTGRLASRSVEGIGQGHLEPWWGSPWADLPRSRFIALPVLSEHGMPTVFDGGTLTSEAILWFQPHDLDVEAVAALLTAGPARDQLRVLSPCDSRGRRILTLEALASLRLPLRIHHLIQDDLRAAYRQGDVDAMKRLSNEIYTGMERSLLRKRISRTPSLFD